jgi:hypothetical protein
MNQFPRLQQLFFFGVAISLLSLTSSALWGVEPLKVFILAGQSNMQGHADVRTLQHLAMNEETKPMLAAIQTPDGTPKVHDQVWISYLSSDGVKQGKLTTGYGANAEKLGPELTFGIYMQQALGEPILLIKTAWGGKSLHTDFRPPSGGPFVFSESQVDQFRKQGKDLEQIQSEKMEATGVAYRDMVAHVKKVLGDIRAVYPDYNAEAGFELAGFVWFQGWNDMVDGGVYPERGKPGGYDQYSVNLAHFIRDVRRDLDAPELPFVIGVLGVGGPTADYGPAEMRYQAVHQSFRDAMAAPSKLAEFQGNVVAVLTEKYWDPELTALRTRESVTLEKAKLQAKEQQLDAVSAKRLETELRIAEFTPRELEILEKGVSNAEFHYLGSARILGGIGKGFAEAMAPLLK